MWSSTSAWEAAAETAAQAARVSQAEWAARAARPPMIQGRAAGVEMEAQAGDPGAAVVEREGCR